MRLQLLLSFFALVCIIHVRSTPHKNNLPAAVRPNSRLTCTDALARCLRRIDRGRATVCLTLPTRPRAFLPAIAPGEFTLEEVRRGVFVYNDGILLSVIVKRGTRLALIDFPDSPSSNTDENDSGTVLTDAIEQVLGTTVPTRVDMIYSHAHLDHIGAALRVFNFLSRKYPDARIEVFGTRETQELVDEHMTDRVISVTRTVGSNGRTLQIASDLRIEMTILGGHTQQDLTILIPREKGHIGVLHLVDMVFPRYSMPFNLAITQNIRSLMEAHREVLTLDFDVLVPGHLRTGNRRDVRLNLAYLEDLIETARIAPSMVTEEQFAGAGLGNVADPNAREFNNAFFGFVAITQLNVDVCYRIMIEKWGCRLASLDLFLQGHCQVALLFVLTSV